MSNQTNTLHPALTFKTAVLFRRAATDGGLWVQMMPGVFSTAEALADGIKTHKALAREAFVYMPVDVALDDKGNPMAVEPIHAAQMLDALIAYDMAVDSGIDADPELWADAARKSAAAQAEG